MTNLVKDLNISGSSSIAVTVMSEANFFKSPSPQTQ